MTLHTRIAVTSSGVDLREAFDEGRRLIGADDRYTSFELPDPTSDSEYRRTATPSLHMEMGQGLPALLWVEVGDGVAEACDPEWCESDCSRQYHDPAHHTMIHFDTSYSYTEPNGASCSDLHAWLVQEFGKWLTERGATWEWYDESGDGWDHGEGWGTLGDPEVGRLGSTVRKSQPDEKRAWFFGEVLPAIAASHGSKDQS